MLCSPYLWGVLEPGGWPEEKCCGGVIAQCGRLRRRHSSECSDHVDDVNWGIHLNTDTSIRRHWYGTSLFGLPLDTKSNMACGPGSMILRYALPHMRCIVRWFSVVVICTVPPRSKVMWKSCGIFCLRLPRNMASHELLRIVTLVMRSRLPVAMRRRYVAMEVLSCMESRH